MALSFIGVPPYYIFQCRPVIGNEMYAVHVETAYDVFEEAKSLVSGLAKRARYTMSHRTGKIEVIGKDDGLIYFKYHQAANHDDYNRLIVCKSNPQAYWFDDYEQEEKSESLTKNVEISASTDSPS